MPVRQRKKTLWISFLQKKESDLRKTMGVWNILSAAAVMIVLIRLKRHSVSLRINVHLCMITNKNLFRCHGDMLFVYNFLRV